MDLKTAWGLILDGVVMPKEPISLEELEILTEMRKLHAMPITIYDVGAVEEVDGKSKVQIKERVFQCKGCGRRLRLYNKHNYCANCGQKLDWDDARKYMKGAKL